ncbi:MAG: O-antigen ligase family protein [Bacteroidota bacterium]|nr:O-antigen ligase family protein [Bacteroidota bacterium]
MNDPIVIVLLIFSAIVLGYIIATGGLISALVLLCLPLLLIYFNRFFIFPRIGILTILTLAFIAIGLNRYIRNVPLGLGIDFILVITYVAIFFKYFNDKLDLDSIKPNKNNLVLLSLIWFLYSVGELANPLALSRTAWFYAMRGMSLYMFLLIPLVFLLFNRVKDLKTFLYIWGGFSIISSLKAFQQMTFGPDPAEQFWLDNGGAVTHLIFGELRAWGIYSDAGQFGAAQAHAGILGTILFLHLKDPKEKIFFLIVALTGYYGMMVSGTRGAIIVPAIGLGLYLIHRKNFSVFFVGVLLLFLFYAFFRYTTIGESNQYIRRMRTAFFPQDNASLQIRIQNRKVLSNYLADKPFGGGIGSAGDWGKRFSPQGFLAQIATDSWYVQIWAEQGIIGLILHLAITFFIVLKGSYILMFRIRDPELFGILSALICGIVGIMGASYGNGVFGQLPTGIIIYISMAFVFLGPKLDEEIMRLKTEKNTIGL